MGKNASFKVAYFKVNQIALSRFRAQTNAVASLQIFNSRSNFDAKLVDIIAKEAFDFGARIVVQIHRIARVDAEALHQLDGLNSLRLVLVSGKREPRLNSRPVSRASIRGNGKRKRKTSNASCLHGVQLKCLLRKTSVLALDDSNHSRCQRRHA